MSHYAVMVIRKQGNTRAFEDDLEFYNEDRGVAPYIYKTKEVLIQDGKTQIDNYKSHEWVAPLVEGMSKADWIKLYEEKSGKTYDDETMSGTWDYYNDIATLVKKQKDGTITDDDYYQYAIKGYEDSEIDDQGNAISTYNPNSKWDWWVVGGRWSGELILKEEAREKYDGQTTVDEAQVKDIDWGKMNSITPEEEERLRKFWKYYVKEEFTGTREELKEEIGFVFYSREYYLNRYKTEDNYIDQVKKWTTRAVLNDKGQWAEVGSMGWFGCSDETDDSANEWTNKFKERFIDPLDPDDVITIIDCHI